MKYSNSDIGNLQSQKTDIEQTNSFNAIETQLSKIDVLETRYFGNNTISGVEGKPVISAALTADPDKIMGEVLPADIISIEKIANDTNVWHPVVASIGTLTNTSSCSEVVINEGLSHWVTESWDPAHGKWYCIETLDISSLGGVGGNLNPLSEQMSPMPFFVTVMGRSLDNLPSASDPKRADYVGFGLSDTVTVKICKVLVQAGEKIKLPCFPVYTKTRVDSYIYSTIDNDGSVENALKRTMPFVSTTFPVPLLVEDEYTIKINDDGDQTGKIWFKNNILSDTPWSEAVMHRHLCIRERALTDYVIETIPLPDEIFYDRQAALFDNLFNKKGSVCNFSKENLKVSYNQEEVCSLDGMQLDGRIYPKVKVFTYTGQGAHVDLEIDYRVSNVYKTTNTNTQQLNNELWYAGEAVYALVPIAMRCTGAPAVTSDNIDLYLHDSDRVRISAENEVIEGVKEIKTFNNIYASNDKNFKLTAYVVSYKETDNSLKEKIVFGMYDTLLGYTYTPAYYGTHPVTDYTSFFVRNINSIIDRSGEKVFVIEYSCDKIEYKCILSCLRASEYYSISSIINYTGLQDNWTVTCDYIDTDYSLLKDSDAKTPVQSNGYGNEYGLSVCGYNTKTMLGNVCEYSLPMIKQKLFAYQKIDALLFNNISWRTNWAKSIRDQDIGYCTPPNKITTSSIFVYGNSCLAWKSPVVNLEHTCGLCYELFLPSYRNTGHAEHMYTVPLYTEAYSLPVFFPLLHAMKNIEERTLIKHGNKDIKSLHNRDTHTIFRRDPLKTFSDLQYMAGIFYKAPLATDTYNSISTAFDYALLNNHLLSISDVPDNRNSFSNSYRKGTGYQVDGIPEPYPRSICYRAGSVGTIMVYPTKALSATGVFTNLDTVQEYNAISFFNKQMIHGLSTASVNGKMYVVKDDRLYKASSMYKLTSCTNEAEDIGILAGSGSVKVYTVGAYLFIVKGQNSEVYYQTEQDLLPVSADSGVIVDSPIVSGMEVYFAVQTTNTIKVYSISKLDVTSRNIITANGLKNVVTFWSSKLVRPCIAYNTDEGLEKRDLHFKAIYQAGIVTACESIQYYTSLFIQRNKINGISQPPVIIMDGASYNVVSSANAANSMSIISSDIDMPEYKGMMFILTGIEVDLVRYGNTQSTVSVSLYNSFNRTLLSTTTFSANDISALQGRIKYNLTPNVNIRRVYYRISSSGYKITGVRLTGYFTELV